MLPIAFNKDKYGKVSKEAATAFNKGRYGKRKVSTAAAFNMGRYGRNRVWNFSERERYCGPLQP